MDNEVLYDSVRNTSSRVAATLFAIPRLPAPPSLYAEKGARYFTVKYAAPGVRSRRTLYIGRVNDDEQQLLAQQIQDSWPARRRRIYQLDDEQVSRLKIDRQVVWGVAKSLAVDLNYHFYGRDMRRRRGVYTHDIESLATKRSQLAQFEQALLALQTYTEELRGMVFTKVSDWLFHRVPRHSTLFPAMSARTRRGMRTVAGLDKDLKAIGIALVRVKEACSKLENTHEDTGN